MTQTQPELLELAKQGNAKAIATLMNHKLQPKGITAKAALKDGCLQMMLESAQVPDQQVLVAFVRKFIISLRAASIERVKVYGRQTGEDIPSWNREFELVAPIPTTSIPTSSFLTQPNQAFQANHYRIHSKKPSQTVNADDYRVALEKEVLYGSLCVLGFIFLILLGISLGLIIVLVAVSAFWVKIRQGQLLGQAVKVSEYQLPEVFQLAQIAAERLCMKMPDVFVKESPILNAYATGFIDDRKTVVLHSALVEAMDEEELISIIGHEFSHIKCHHTNWIVLTNTAENVAKIPLISDIVGFVFLLWSRKCEYTCDRGGLLASRNLRASTSALAKLAVGKKLFEKMNIDALLEQKQDIDASETSRISEIFATHPHIINRIHELNNFDKSDLYRKLTAE